MAITNIPRPDHQEQSLAALPAPPDEQTDLAALATDTPTIDSFTEVYDAPATPDTTTKADQLLADTTTVEATPDTAEEPEQLEKPKSGKLSRKKIGAIIAGATLVVAGAGAALGISGGGDNQKAVATPVPEQTDPQTAPETAPQTEASTDDPEVYVNPERVPKAFVAEIWKVESMPIKAATADNPDELLIELNELYAIANMDKDESRAEQALATLSGGQKESETLDKNIREMRRVNLEENSPTFGARTTIGSLPNAKVVRSGDNFMIVQTYNEVMDVRDDELSYPQAKDGRGAQAYYHIRIDPNGQKRLTSIEGRLTDWQGEDRSK